METLDYINQVLIEAESGWVKQDLADVAVFESSVCNLLNPTQMAKPDTGYVESDLNKDAVKWFL